MENIEDGAWLIYAIKVEGAAWIWAKSCGDENEASENVVRVTMEARAALIRVANMPQPNPSSTRDPHDFVNILAIGSTTRTREGFAAESIMNAIRPGKALDLAWCANQVACLLDKVPELAGAMGPYECAGFESEADGEKLGLAFAKSQLEAREVEAASAMGKTRSAGKASL